MGLATAEDLRLHLLHTVILETVTVLCHAIVMHSPGRETGVQKMPLLKQPRLKSLLRQTFEDEGPGVRNSIHDSAGSRVPRV